MLPCRDLHVAWGEFDMDVYPKNPTGKPQVGDSSFVKMHPWHTGKGLASSYIQSRSESFNMIVTCADAKTSGGGELRYCLRRTSARGLEIS